jgi:hypothetical protein
MQGKSRIGEANWPDGTGTGLLEADSRIQVPVAAEELDWGVLAIA